MREHIIKQQLGDNVMRTALYIRVSTQEQLDGFSISAQKRQLTAYCESQGWDIAGYYVEEGISAKDTKRPELQRMISHIKNDLIDCVLVYKLDRLTRSVLDLYNLLQIFEENDCKFKSATEVYDTTSAIGRMFITLVASFAQFERERLAERVSMGMEQMTREGKWKGGHIGYGHDRIDGKMVIIEEEANVLKDMYDWYIKGMSDRKIAVKLNDLSITTRSGAEWTEGKVRYALTNKKNIGTLQYGVRVNQDKSFDVEDIYPPIIDEKTFNQANAARIARRRFHGKQATSNYYFSGIATCSRCGTTLKGIKSRGYKRYKCRNTIYKKCDLPTFSESMIEHNFLKHLKVTSFDKNKIELPDNKADIRKIKRIEKELKKIKNRMKKWQYAWANEAITDEDFRERMAEERERERMYKEQLKELHVSESKSIDVDILEMMQSAVRNWKLLDDAEKKQLMQIAVDKVIVDIDDELKNTKNYDKLIIKKIEFN